MRRGADLRRMAGMALLVGLAALPARPAAAESGTVPGLRPGCVETAFLGSLSSVAGDTQVRAVVLGTRFLGAPGGLWSLGVETGFVHVAGLDAWELEAQVAWSGPGGRHAVYPFLMAGVGLRQEHVGSFETARYPLGIGAGLRVPVAAAAGVRVEYRFRRLLHDPVADFTEHRVELGIGLYWGNS